MSIFALVVFAGMLAIVMSIIERNRNGGSTGRNSDGVDLGNVNEVRAYGERYWAEYNARNRPALEAQIMAEVRASIAADEAAERAAAVKAAAQTTQKTATTSSTSAIADVTSALVGLGWQASESRPLAQKAVQALGPQTGTEALVRYALSGK